MRSHRTVLLLGLLLFTVGGCRNVVSPSVAADILVAGPWRMTVGEEATFVARVRDGRRDVIPGASVTWVGSPGSVVLVSDDGRVTAVGVGDATITASSGGVSGSAKVLVVAP